MTEQKKVGKVSEHRHEWQLCFDLYTYCPYWTMIKSNITKFGIYRTKKYLIFFKSLLR